MTTPINQAHGIPRIVGRGGFPLSRGQFLDGKAKVYYGPKHRSNLFAQYRNPGDWPEAGALLRVPRVVWLHTAHRHAVDGLGPVLTQFFVNFYTEPQFPGEGPELHPPATGLYHQGPDGLSQTVGHTANADYAERFRLLAVFQEVKDRIESIQPGRCWVEIMDWNDPRGFDPDSAPYATPADDYFSDGFLQIAAPQADPGPFFGTDFLNVWAGSGFFDAAFRTNFVPYVPTSPPDDDPLIGRPKSRLVAAYPDFRRHATKLYHPGQVWGLPDVGPDPAAALTTGYADFAELGAESNASDSGLFDTFASDMADLGFEHPGPTTGLDADSLVKLIADHFRFDPDTGRDLP